MKCSHKKAISYLQALNLNKKDDYKVSVKCNRCKKYIGEEAEEYKLPVCFSEIKKISLKFYT